MAAALTGVGQELAAAREARGLALADVAQQLKFAPRQLEALEQEQFGALPGATFAKGMVRSYARLLKLDPEPLLQRVAGHFEVPDSGRLAARYHQPVPFSDSARKSTFVYLGLSAGVLVLVGAVAYEWQQERTRMAKPGSKATTVAKAAPREAPPRPAPVAVQPAMTPAPAQEKTKLAAAPAPAIPANAPAAITPEKPKVASAEKPKVFSAGPHRLVVRTEAEAWIEIRDAADRMLVSSLNPPGSERVVRGKPPYSLVIGNASMVTVLYDDKPIDLAPHTRQDVARLTVP
jgi:cytoskeleton protein RodZ